MLIKEIMNKAVAIEQDISLKQAAKIMSDKNIGSLVVVKGKNISGILTEKDILKNISDLDKKIHSAMSKNVITINENVDIDEAAMLMSKNKIKRLPVLDHENGKLIGIITSTDLVAHSEEISDEFLFD
jgi:CBS domain-containing protein